ncbi:hypothetical protein FRZ44_16620 [Hypericibacter terrae]|uniref:Uncharacterized protein n=1 Tax=Hypericibacter terrae TaxID=2602015 RepID=A0A5J6MG30_9PROT|nr:hypothetical protein FRZ44_16620 [Hypericibacter terrae]
MQNAVQFLGIAVELLIRELEAGESRDMGNGLAVERHGNPKDGSGKRPGRTLRECREAGKISPAPGARNSAFPGAGTAKLPDFRPILGRLRPIPRR